MVACFSPDEAMLKMAVRKQVNSKGCSQTECFRWSAMGAVQRYICLN